jgi:hypothetical protein
MTATAQERFDSPVRDAVEQRRPLLHGPGGVAAAAEPVGEGETG